jgi:plasmid stabilization system protein ParE
MPRGDKSKYTDKQERMADHIEEGYEKRGVGHKEAERRAWATVNKQTGGGNKPGGSGRGKRDTSAGSMTHEERSRAAKKGWRTRKRSG